MEAQADIAGELVASSAGTTNALEDKFKELDGNSQIEEELELMVKHQRDESQDGVLLVVDLVIGEGSRFCLSIQEELPFLKV